LRYLQPDDRKRALVSRLLARRGCAVALALPHAAVRIARTRGRKPFLAAPRDGGGGGGGGSGVRGPIDGRRSDSRVSLPNFNFNVSHEGDYVVLASEVTQRLRIQSLVTHFSAVRG